MALSTSPKANNSFNKADAFLNILAKDKNGNTHRLGGLPFHKNKAAHAAIIDALTANPDLVLDLVVELKVIDEEPAEIAFA